MEILYRKIIEELKRTRDTTEVETWTERSAGITQEMEYYSISGTMKRKIIKSDTKRVCITYVDPIEKHNALLPCRSPTKRQEWSFPWQTLGKEVVLYENTEYSYERK